MSEICRYIRFSSNGIYQNQKRGGAKYGRKRAKVACLGFRTK